MYKKYSFRKSDSLGVKGMAIMLMLFDHLFIEVIWCDVDLSRLNYFPLGEKMISYLSASSRFCVTMFAFLTCYALTVKYDAERQKGGMRGIKAHAGLALERYFASMSGYWVVFPFAIMMTMLFDEKRNFIYVYGFDQNIPLAIFRLILELFGFSTTFGQPTVNYVWWYMGFITIVLIIMPLAMRLLNKYWALIMIIGMTVLMISTGTISIYMDYLCIPYGIFAVRSGLFEYISSKLINIRKVVITAIICLLLIAVCLKIRQINCTAPVTDSIITLSACVLYQDCFSRIKYVRVFLETAGKYSMNIFMLHTLFITLFARVIYSFNYWVAIWAVLFSISIAASYIIERCKMISGVDGFVGKIRSAIEVHTYGCKN